MLKYAQIVMMVNFSQYQRTLIDFSNLSLPGQIAYSLYFCNFFLQDSQKLIIFLTNNSTAFNRVKLFVGQFK